MGRSKADVLRERATQINPQVELTVIEDFFTAKTAETILAPSYDVVVDCIDQFKNKVLMLDACRKRKQKIVVVGGAGGRKDPTRIRVADISRSEGDVLLAMLRKRLRQKHGFPRKGTWGVKCVYSDEVPTMPEMCEVPTTEKPLTAERLAEQPLTAKPFTEKPLAEQPPTAEPFTEKPTTENRDPGSGIRDQTAEKSLRLDCSSGYGAATFVTGTFGFMASAAVIDVILRRANATTS